VKLLIEIIGWTGSFMVIAAYGLNSYQKIKSDSMIFLLFNFVGGLLLILYTYYKETYASTFLNVVWVIIAIPALLKFLKHKAA
jgi:hypothetical protein